MGSEHSRPARGVVIAARRAAAALGLAVTMMAAMVAVPAPQAAAAPITITYEVRGEGNATSLEDFAELAAETLADSRGWGLGGSIRFARVGSGGQFTLWLSAARYLPTFSAGCSTRYSCRVGRDVIINETPFREATPAWRATGASLRNYQHMVVNHETGHWLGFGHSSCPSGGAPAPAMQQQSKSMQGCRPNAWPTASERATLSQWRGAPVLPPKPPPPPRVSPGAVVQVAAAGAPGTRVPADAEAVAATITVTDPIGAGDVTAYPCGTAVPPTPSVKITSSGQTAAAFTLVKPGADGSICVRPSTEAHLVVDISGYVPAGRGYRPVPPRRLLDSRTDGPASRRTFSVALPAGVTAAALTATVTQPAAPGFLMVWPCESRRPLAATLSFTAGQTVANMTVAKAGADGRVCLRPSTAAHVVVDLVGTFPARSGYVVTAPQRPIDTRAGAKPSGVTRAALPTTGPRALTVMQPVAPGWASVNPCGSAPPATSNVTLGRGQTVANAVISAAGGNSRLCIAGNVPTHVIVEDSGAVNDVATVPAVRLLDTRRR
jgi:hypothetical protein